MKSFHLQKESIKSEIRNSNYDQKKFENKSAWNQILNFQIMFKFIIWKEGSETKILALVSLDLEERAKSCEGLKIRDKNVRKEIADRSLAENKIKRKILSNER